MTNAAFSVDFLPVHPCSLSLLLHADAGEKFRQLPFHLCVQEQVFLQEHAAAVRAEHPEVDDCLVAGRNVRRAGISGTVELLHGEAIIALRQQNEVAFLLDFIIPAQFVTLCSCVIVFHEKYLPF